MKIYNIEQKLGLAEKITACKSISYTSELEPVGDAPNLDHLFAGARAGVNDTDLYRTKSILVTTNWNKNDDVFRKDIVWASKDTASHKPTNLEHNEKVLVGHITSCWAVKSDGTVLSSDTPLEDVPDLFHLVNGAVIYTSWEDPELVERTKSLIKQIEAGEKFVSMECLFADFGYAIITPEGGCHMIDRNESTAFLSKHLRSYGGTGEYNNHKIGRLLKDITFSGKGYVDHPANPNSVIFNDATTFQFSKASTENPFKSDDGVLYNQRVDSSIVDDSMLNPIVIAHIDADSTNKFEKELIDMSDILTNQNAELKSTVAKQSDEIKELRDLIAKSGVEKLEAGLNDAKATNETLANDLKDSLANVDTLSTEKSELESQLSEANKAKSDLETKVAETEVKALTASRVSILVDGDVAKEDAEAKVELYKGLSDEQFDAVAAEIISAVKANKDGDDKKKRDKDKADSADADEDEQDEADASADESVVDDAKTDDNDVALATVSDTGDELADARDALGRIFAKNLGVDADEKE